MEARDGFFFGHGRRSSSRIPGGEGRKGGFRGPQIPPSTASSSRSEPAPLRRGRADRPWAPPTTSRPTSAPPGTSLRGVSPRGRPWWWRTLAAWLCGPSRAAGPPCRSPDHWSPRTPARRGEDRRCEGTWRTTRTWRGGRTADDQHGKQFTGRSRCHAHSRSWIDYWGIQQSLAYDRNHESSSLPAMGSVESCPKYLKWRALSSRSSEDTMKHQLTAMAEHYPLQWPLSHFLTLHWSSCCSWTIEGELQLHD